MGEKLLKFQNGFQLNFTLLLENGEGMGKAIGRESQQSHPGLLRDIYIIGRLESMSRSHLIESMVMDNLSLQSALWMLDSYFMSWMHAIGNQ